jgi:hypothetical protein
MKEWGGRPFSGKKDRGGTPFLAKKENIYILGNFGDFVAQKVPKYSKIALNSLFGSF